MRYILNTIYIELRIFNSMFTYSAKNASSNAGNSSYQFRAIPTHATHAYSYGYWTLINTSLTH